MARVVVLGSLNLDLVVAVESLPERGQTIFAREVKRFGGGKGANQALAAARMGAETILVGRVGRDDAGAFLVEQLAAGGVKVERVLRSDGATGLALITVDASGSNTIVVDSGANAMVNRADVDAAADLIRSHDCLILQLEVPLEANLHAARIARQAGRAVLLNPSPVMQLTDDFLSCVSYLVLNEGELRHLAGGADDPRVLLDRGVGAVIVTLGERGARYVDRSRSVDVPAFPVDPVDTTAAGDAFMGAFAATLAEQGVERAVRAACAAGAIAATRWGAQPSLPTRDEVDRLIAERAR